MVELPMDDDMVDESGKRVEINDAVGGLVETEMRGDENKDPNVQEIIGQESGKSCDLEKHRKVKSYKDKLLGFNGGEELEHGDRDALTEMMDEEEEEGVVFPEGEEVITEEEEDPMCQVVKVNKAELLEFCKPWKTSLIVKLLGKRLSMKFLHTRLQKI